MRISRRILERMTEIERSLERLDVAVITRYPDSQRAADSYDALRKGIISNASAATISQQNLIALANSIDDGADTSTLRLKISDLLGTFQVREITSEEFDKTLPDRVTYTQVFHEVGESAHPRPAWVRIKDDGLEVVQKGYVAEFPEFTKLDEQIGVEVEIVEEPLPGQSVEASAVPEHPSNDSQSSDEVHVKGERTD